MILLLLLENYHKKIILYLILCLTGLIFIINSSFSANFENNKNLFKKGVSIYKKASCSSCHFWHANGGNSHGGAASSLRNTQLSFEEIYNVISCGKPGTNMPYFSRLFKSNLDCVNYKNKPLEDDKIVVLKGSKLLNNNEINVLAKFISQEIKNKTITRKYCEAFFKTEEACFEYY